MFTRQITHERSNKARTVKREEEVKERKGKSVKEKEKKAETGNDVSGMTEGDIEI